MDSVNIYAVGDMMFGDSHVNIGSGVRAMCRRQGYDYPFKKIYEYLNQSDALIIGNLECALSSAKSRFSHKPYIGDIEMVETLSQAGFDALSMANNHIFEYGLGPATETANKIAQKNIKAFGLPDQDGGETQINYRGVTLGLAGYSMVPTLENDVFERNTQKIEHRVKTLSDRSDVTIVSIHWGAEFVNFPSPQQIQFGHELVDAGARLVIGHHPHVLQPIEKFHGGLIAYSLGNFVFDTYWLSGTFRSGILRVDLPLNNTGAVDASVVPIQINRDYQPEADETLVLTIEEFNTLITADSSARFNQSISDEIYLSIAQKNRRHASEEMKAYLISKPHKHSFATYRQILAQKIFKTIRKRTLPAELVNASWALTSK
jgi:poly-gamma-glutamate synthesis protein (capsule biosynthesis protein)